MAKLGGRLKFSVLIWTKERTPFLPTFSLDLLLLLKKITQLPTKISPTDKKTKKLNKIKFHGKRKFLGFQTFPPLSLSSRFPQNPPNPRIHPSRFILLFQFLVFLLFRHSLAAAEAQEGGD